MADTERLLTQIDALVDQLWDAHFNDDSMKIREGVLGLQGLLSELLSDSRTAPVLFLKEGDENG
jgi:hypothetical protein